MGWGGIVLSTEKELFASLETDSIYTIVNLIRLVQFNLALPQATTLSLIIKGTNRSLVGK